MARTGVDNLEDLKPLKLDPEARARLLETQTECTFIFAAATGWPRGVIMSLCTRRTASGSPPPPTART